MKMVMGPMKKVLGMLPGVGQLLKQVDLDDKHFSQMEAIILSMTPLERRNPDLIQMERRRRIARGSGNPLDKVNAMIKQFKAMQKMMKGLGGGGMPGLGDAGAADGFPGFGGAGLSGQEGKLPRRPPGGGLSGFLGGRKR